MQAQNKPHVISEDTASPLLRQIFPVFHPAAAENLMGEEPDVVLETLDCRFLHVDFGFHIFIHPPAHEIS